MARLTTFRRKDSNHTNTLSGSKTLFNLSSTLSSAKEISSIKKKSPHFIACTRGPSCHSKIVCHFWYNWWRFCRICLKESWQNSILFETVFMASCRQDNVERACSMSEDKLGKICYAQEENRYIVREMLNEENNWLKTKKTARKDQVKKYNYMLNEIKLTLLAEECSKTFDIFSCSMEYLYSAANWDLSLTGWNP